MEYYYIVEVKWQSLLQAQQLRGMMEPQTGHHHQHNQSLQ